MSDRCPVCSGAIEYQWPHNWREPNNWREPIVPQLFCKGDWLLGTACGRCTRCVDTAPKVISKMRMDREREQRELKLIMALIPPLFTNGTDFEPDVKIKLFEALRLQLYNK